MGRLLGDALASDLRFERHHRIAVGIQQRLHEVRLHHVAVVREGRDSGDQADRRDRDALSVGHGRQLDRAAVLVLQDVAAFARIVHAGALGDAERVEPCPETRGADALHQLHHGDVAGVHDRLGQVLPAVRVRVVPALQLPVVYLDGRAAVELLRQIRDAGIQRDGRGQEFERGTGFVRVADVEITPHLVPVIHLFFRRHLREGFRVLRQRVSRVIGVVLAGLGAGQDLAVLRVHDQAHDPRRLRLFLAGRDLLLHDVLDVLVYGQDRGVAVFRAEVGILAVGQRVSRVVLVLDPAAVQTRQIAVVSQFDAGQAVVVVRRAADHLGRERAERIVPLGILRDLQTGKLLRAQRVRRVSVHVLGDLQQFALRRDDLHHVVEIHAERIGQRLRFQLDVQRFFFVCLAVVAHLVRAYPDRVRRRADRQIRAVAVHDASAGRENGRVGRLLTRRFRRVFVALDDHMPA